MAAKRKRVRMLLDVTAPAGMTSAQVRREVRTRIDRVGPHYDAFSIGLPDSAEGSDGYIRVRVAKMRPAR